MGSKFTGKQDDSPRKRINNTARQVAGSIGTAILITIMTIVSTATVSAGSVQSILNGMQAAYGAAAGLSAVALIMTIAFVKRTARDDDIFCD